MRTTRTGLLARGFTFGDSHKLLSKKSKTKWTIFLSFALAFSILHASIRMQFYESVFQQTLCDSVNDKVAKDITFPYDNTRWMSYGNFYKNASKHATYFFDFLQLHYGYILNSLDFWQDFFRLPF